ncbi:MAG: hypothetical protein AB8H03_28710, partial [Saprospiraceae bacterium]
MRTFQILIIIVIFFSCYENDDYSIKKINPDEIILSITSEKDTVLANNTERTVLSVELPLEADDSLSKVSFKTSKGTFLESGENKAEEVAKLIFENDIGKRIAQ